MPAQNVPPAPVRIADAQVVLGVQAVERRGDALGDRAVDRVARLAAG